MKRWIWVAALALVACDATEVTGDPADTGPAEPTQDMFVPPAPEPDPAPTGQLGDPCGSSSDCASGFCVPGPDGEGVCTIACVEGEANGCPAGWHCENNVQFGQPVCIPDQRLPICEPCTDDRQCGGPRDLCLPLFGQPGNSACARDCANRECPNGFTCQQFGEGQQCVPDDGVCPDEIPMDDRDGDGVPDDDDACPDEFGAGLDGCPIEDDRDNDGVPDDQDACPDEFGAGPDGCPILDGDNDGVPDSQDACLDQAGSLPNGCPVGGINGEIVSGGGPFQLFGSGLRGVLGGFGHKVPMSSPSYRIQPMNTGVNP